MYLPTTFGFTLFGVFDRGQPNKERIIVRNDVPINLAQYGLLRGIKRQENLATPLPDSFFWFGELMLDVPTLVYIYTGPGTMRLTQASETNHPAVVLHWGSKITLFHEEVLVPILFRLDSVIIESTPVENWPLLASARK